MNKLLLIITLGISVTCISFQVFAKEYTLSQRTYEQYKEFSELQNDMSSMQSIGTILMTVAPFRSLLNGASVITPVEIASSEWALIASASGGLSSHYKSQLKTFAQLEALKQKNSSADYRFWKNLAEQFN